MASPPGTAVEVDPGTRRMCYGQNGRDWNRMRVETGRGAEASEVTAPDVASAISAGLSGGDAGSFGAASLPRAMAGLMTCAKN